jgi:inner membrane protein
MDNLTHSLVGAVLGQAGLKRTTGLAMPALIIGANLPDVDAACFFWLEGTEHLAFRRGITHGPPALVLLPLILAGILWGWDRWQTKRGTRPEGRLPVRFGWLYAMAFIGCLSHPFFDWLNVYGIRLLEPFSSQWFYGDTLFIIDPWLWAILIASVWWSRRREKAGAEWMRPARVGIAIGLAYIGVNGVISHQAVLNIRSAHPNVDRSPRVLANPLPLAFWQREVIYLDLQKAQWMSVGYSPIMNSDQPVPVAPNQCLLYVGTPTQLEQFDAFAFWSRAPFFEIEADGGMTLRDARFTDPRVADRFSLALPDYRCQELPAP